MATVLELRKKNNDLAASRKAIATKAANENRGLTTEEQAQFDKLGEERGQLASTIKALEAAETEEAELRSSAGTIDRPPVAGGGNGAAASVRVGEERARRDPFGGFESFHEVLTAVRRATQHGEDKRLAPFRQGKQDEEGSGYVIPAGFVGMLGSRRRRVGLEARTVGTDEMQGGNNPFGGFLVNQAPIATLLQVPAEDAPVLGMLTPLRMGAPSVPIPARTDKTHTSSVSGGLRFYRRPETVQATASRMQTEKITFNASMLIGLAYATEELLADSAVSLTSIIDAGFRDELAGTLMNELMFGNGNGELEGIVNAPAAVTITRNAATDIKFVDIVSMRSRCWGYGNAVWLANHDTYPKLAQLSLAVGTGGSAVYQPSLVEDRPDRLNGRPIYYTEFCQTLGTVGDLVCFNPTQYLFGEYQPLQMASSIHVRFDYHEQCFKFFTRNCGACWWRSALTPKNSTSTLSPIVTLT